MNNLFRKLRSEIGDVVNAGTGWFPGGSDVEDFALPALAELENYGNLEEARDQLEVAASLVWMNHGDDENFRAGGGDLDLAVDECDELLMRARMGMYEDCE